MKISMSERLHKYRHIEDLKDMLNQSADIFGDKPAFIFKTDKPNQYDFISYNEYKKQVEELGTALIDLGLKGKRIAIIGENRYEWALAYMAVVAGTGVVVPLDKSLPYKEIESLVTRSEVEAIFYTKPYKDTMEKISQENTSNLKIFINMDNENLRDGELYIGDLKEKGKELIKKGNRICI